jgi:hypothetical protein
MRTGWKTTEAWVTGLVAWLAIDLVNQSAYEWVQVAGVAAGALVASTYIWSRTRIKELELPAEDENAK